MTSGGKGDITRDQILAAAEKLLIETGSDEAVSIRAVADLVGVTAPTIYRHFGDKQNLLFEVCARQFDLLDTWLSENVTATDDSIAAVRAAGRSYIEFGIAHPEHYRIMFMGRSDLTPEQYSDEVLAADSCFARFALAVQRCIDEGRFRTDGPAGSDAFLIAISLWSAVHGLTSLLVAKPNFPWPPLGQIIDATLDTQLHGLEVR